MPQQDQAMVKVVFRGVTLLESSVMQDLTDEGGFIQTDGPMPVGTALSVFPDDSPDTEVGVSVAGVVELRKARRGVDQPQPGMQLQFQGSAEAFFQALQGFEEEEPSFQMDAEPPDSEEEAGGDESPPVNTTDFVLVDGEPVDRDEYLAGQDDAEGEEEPPELPEDDEEAGDEDEPPAIPDDDEDEPPAIPDDDEEEEEEEEEEEDKKE